MRKGVALICPFAAALTLAMSAVSAGADVILLDKEYDFGLMKEVAGPITGYARLYNAGPDTISVLDVKPSCGCTSAGFPEAPMAPGDTARISFTYDPAMRPGRFLKSVKILFSDNSRKTVYISGNVLGTPESLQVLYPVDAGRLRLTDYMVDFGVLNMGRTATHFVNAYVLSPDSVQPVVTIPREGLTVTPSVGKAGPGDIVTYSLVYDTGAAKNYGPVQIPVQFSASPSEPGATVSVKAEVIPDARMLSIMQKGKSPVANLTADFTDLGNVPESGNITFSIEVENSGNAPLHILKAYSNSEAFSFSKLPAEIKKGKRKAIEITADAALLPAGPSQNQIYILTDDPQRVKMQARVASLKKP
ncbi:MAG: DUF1573 domain-containing protein [Candidatus Amulumruptor caecigallinarius]|nr:DUF1573 domain-containing protein [Candidatus Amulumruptor caecigallinarius]